MLTNDLLGPDSPDGPPPALAPSAASARRRPFGLYAILILLTAQAGLVMALTGMAGAAAYVTPEAFWVALGPDRWAFLLAGTTSLLALVAAIGLWRYQPWAWTLMMAVLAVWLAADAWRYFYGAPNSLSTFLSVVTVFYLNQSDVRERFLPARRKGAGQ